MTRGVRSHFVIPSGREGRHNRPYSLRKIPRHVGEDDLNALGQRTLRRWSSLVFTFVAFDQDHAGLCRSVTHFAWLGVLR